MSLLRALFALVGLFALAGFIFSCGVYSPLRGFIMAKGAPALAGAALLLCNNAADYRLRDNQYAA